MESQQQSNPSTYATATETPEFNPLAPDAPIAQLLSISTNPQVKDLDDQQLMELVKRVRTLATSPQTLSAKLQTEGRVRKSSKTKTPEQLRRQAIIDSL